MNTGDVFQIALDGFPREEGTVPQGMISETAKTDDGKTVLRLSGGDRDAVSSERTEGYSIRVPDCVEAAASGRSVRVTLKRALGARGRNGGILACLLHQPRTYRPDQLES